MPKATILKIEQGGQPLLLPSLPILIWAPDFHVNGGGAIVLHSFAHMLGKLGAEVYIGNVLPKPVKLLGAGFLQRLKQRFRLANRQRLARKRGKPIPKLANLPGVVDQHPSMPISPLVYMGQRPFIAIYPEIVAGNPFGAKHVVRWLLHRPGFFFPDVVFGPNEYTFFYQPAFAETTDNIDPSNLLRIRWLREDVYVDRKLSIRSGSCRMIRKGHADKDMLAADTAILLDGKSHEEIADIFNRTERFYCHDPYTLYVYYAALCGCTPIIVPQPGLESEVWRAGFELKNGVAYGEAEVDWAIATRKKLLADMKQASQAEGEAVMVFLQKIKKQFHC